MLAGIRTSGGHWRRALRVWARTPEFAAVTVVTLALGLGASVAISSVIYAVIIQPLPYPNRGRLVMVWDTVPKEGPGRIPVSEGAYPIYRRQSRSFEKMAAFTPPPDVDAGGKPLIAGTDEHVTLSACTAELFEILRTKPFLGRLFIPSDDRWGADGVVVISYSLWQRRYNSTPKAIGKTLTLLDSSDRKFEFGIVGVMPQDFSFPYPLSRDKPDVWEAIRVLPPNYLGVHGLQVLGLLNPGVTPARAGAELRAIAQQITREDPGYEGAQPVVEPLNEEAVRGVAPLLWILFAAVSLLLVLSCANVSNMMLTRGAHRLKEMGVRMALGATRWTLVLEMLAESSPLAVAGGSLGVLLAVWLVKVFRTLVPPELHTPRLDQASLSGPVLIYALGLSLAATILSGTLPALRLSRPGIGATLNSGAEGGRLDGVPFLRLGNLLVITELAIAVAVVSGGLLLARSLHRLSAVELAFEPSRLVKEEILLNSSAARLSPEQTIHLYDDVLDISAHVPGVKAAAFASPFPIGGDIREFRAVAAGSPTSAPFLPAEAAWVTPGFFRIMGMRAKAGRLLGATDTPGAPPVAVINDAMARRYWPSESPLGRQLQLGTPMPGEKPTYYTIVGVVPESRRFGSGERAGPSVYLPWSQEGGEAWGTSLIARTAVAPDQIAAALRDAIQAALPGEVSVPSTRTGEQIVAERTARLRFVTIGLGTLAVLALVLAATGVYGLNSYVTSRRAREIAIRMALGAQPQEVVWLVVSRSMKVAVAGISLGIAAGLAFAQLARSLLFDLSPLDPGSTGGTVILLAAAALFGCYLPARQAARTDPLNVLREQ